MTLLTTLLYLDPGSGSFIIQLLIGGIAGLVLILKTYWGRIRHFFGKKADPDTPLINEHDTSDTGSE